MFVLADFPESAGLCFKYSGRGAKYSQADPKIVLCHSIRHYRNIFKRDKKYKDFGRSKSEFFLVTPRL